MPFPRSQWGLCCRCQMLQKMQKPCHGRSQRSHRSFDGEILDFSEVSRCQGDLSYDPDSKTSDFGVLDQDERCQTLQTECWAFVNLGHLKSCILMHVKRDLGWNPGASRFEVPIVCFWPVWNSQLVGCKNAFSKISVGFVLQVPDAAEDAEAMPWTKPEIPQVIRWGNFRFFRSFQVSRWSFIWSRFQNFRLRGFRSRWTLSDFANWVLSLCQSWTS